MTSPILGIDIAKLKFNVCLINSSGKLRHKVFANTSLGFDQLLDWLSKHHVERAHACMEATGTLLDSIPGIAQTTAALLLAEITDIKQYRSARQVAAYAGLVPRERQSGSSVRGRTRLSKIGNARLRKALYSPPITALRCSAFFQSWAEGLRQRGKCKMSVIGAAMRKLIHLAYGVLKTGKPFDPGWAKSA